MAREPRPRNSFNCPQNLWKRLTEEERHHYNKVFLYCFERKEEFIGGIDFPPEDWVNTARRIAIVSASTMRRGRMASYYKD